MYLIIDLDAADLIVGMGGQDILRRYSSEHKTWRFYIETKKRQHVSCHDNNSVTAHLVGELCISSMTWSGNVVYSDG